MCLLKIENIDFYELKESTILLPVTDGSLKAHGRSECIGDRN